MPPRVTYTGLCVAVLMTAGFALLRPFPAAQDAQTQRLHMVRQQRERDLHCREAAQRARATARQLRESAQREPLDRAAVLRLRTELAERIAGLETEHREFVASLTAAQKAAVTEPLAYMDDIQERLQRHLAAVQETAEAGKAALLLRHCRVLERDLMDWADQHAAITAKIGLHSD